SSGSALLYKGIRLGVPELPRAGRGRLAAGGALAANRSGDRRKGGAADADGARASGRAFGRLQARPGHDLGAADGPGQAASFAERLRAGGGGAGPAKGALPTG